MPTKRKVVETKKKPVEVDEEKEIGDIGMEPIVKDEIVAEEEVEEETAEMADEDINPFGDRWEE